MFGLNSRYKGVAFGLWANQLPFFSWSPFMWKPTPSIWLILLFKNLIKPENSKLFLTEKSRSIPLLLQSSEAPWWVCTSLMRQMLLRIFPNASKMVFWVVQLTGILLKNLIYFRFCFDFKITFEALLNSQNLLKLSKLKLFCSFRSDFEALNWKIYKFEKKISTSKTCSTFYLTINLKITKNKFD